MEVSGKIPLRKLNLPSHPSKEPPCPSTHDDEICPSTLRPVVLVHFIVSRNPNHSLIQAGSSAYIRLSKIETRQLPPKFCHFSYKPMISRWLLMQNWLVFARVNSISSLDLFEQSLIWHHILSLTIFAISVPFHILVFSPSVKLLIDF